MRKGFAPIVIPIIIALAIIIVIIIGKSKANPVTITSSIASPTPNIHSNWKTFSSPQFYFSFKYPNDWIEQPLPTPSSSGGLFLIYSPDAKRDPNLGSLAKGTEVSIDNPVNNIGYPAPTGYIEDDSFIPPALKDHTLGFRRPNFGQTGAILNQNKFIYIIINCFEVPPAVISCKQILNQILSTINLKFTENQNQLNYTCPTSPYVNCMPQVGTPSASYQMMCSTNYLTWAKTNCPNFKGAAY